ncbi:hypothetical protein [Cognatishimia sp.]|uniref:hypothetical protein n=1 Tax=Cognatishimia sp. TaxID=2211648 RepID=UPI0035197ACD|nr:hypothetical protein [Cognatishimia sp.]
MQRNSNWKILAVRAIIILLLLTPAITPAKGPNLYRAIQKAAFYTIKEEGFRKCAYWDYSRYSIGYGTIAKSSFECLAKGEQEAKKIARSRMLTHLSGDAIFIIKRKPMLNTEQLAILTAAAYNSGRAGILKAVDKAPNKDQVALELRKNHKNLSGVKKRVNMLADTYLEVS